MAFLGTRVELERSERPATTRMREAPAERAAWPRRRKATARSRANSSTRRSSTTWTTKTCRRTKRSRPRWARLAILTIVASLVVWLGVTFVRVPYGDGPESPETIAYVTKIVEVVALVALVLLVVLSSAIIRSAGRAVTAVLVVALLLGAASGGAAYGAGLVAAKVLPSLGPTDGDGMDMAPASHDGDGSGTTRGPT